MSNLRQAAQQALDYIRSTTDYKMGHPPACEAALDLADALAEQPTEQPRFFWDEVDGCLHEPSDTDRPAGCIPLYTAPQPAKQPLTDAELRDALRSCPHDTVENLRVRWLYAKDFARAVERTHGITSEANGEAK